VNHPEIRSGLFRCASCGRAFCQDCVVSLQGQRLCLTCKDERVRAMQSGVAEGRLGVTEILRLAWNVLTRQFWAVWVVGLVFLALQFASGLVQMVPFIGGLLAIAVTIFVQPPLTAGVVYALLRVIDGGPATVDDVFEGFRRRYLPSIVVMLPMWGVSIVIVMVFVGIAIVLGMATGMFKEGRPPDGAMIPFMIVVVVGVIVVVAATVVLQAVAMLAYVGLWETHESGWLAFLEAWGIFRANTGSTIGLIVMLGLVGLGAALAGILALCVGLIITMPFAVLWANAAYIYAYRSWRSDLGTWSPAQG
jgi:hypothetical protein